MPIGQRLARNLDWKTDVDSGGEVESAIQPIIYLRHLLKREKALSGS